MVKEDKNKDEDNNEGRKLPKINFKSLIIGAVIFLFFPVLAYRQHLDAITVFASLGPIYIGYKAEEKIKGLILGLIASIPLLYVALIGALGPLASPGTNVSHNTAIIVTSLCVLGIGALIGLFGAHLYQRRSRVKAEYEAKKPAGSKNRPVKKNKKVNEKGKNKKPKDTGSVSQNIVNLFKPRK